MLDQKVMAEGDDVVNIYEERLSLKPASKDVERPMEDGWCINQPKGHMFDSIRALLAAECCLVPVSLMAWRLPIPRVSVECCEYAGLSQGINVVVHPG